MTGAVGSLDEILMMRLATDGAEVKRLCAKHLIPSVRFQRRDQINCWLRHGWAAKIQPPFLRFVTKSTKASEGFCSSSEVWRRTGMGCALSGDGMPQYSVRPESRDASCSLGSA